MQRKCQISSPFTPLIQDTNTCWQAKCKSMQAKLTFRWGSRWCSFGGQTGKCMIENRKLSAMTGNNLSSLRIRTNLTICHGHRWERAGQQKGDIQIIRTGHTVRFSGKDRKIILNGLILHYPHSSHQLLFFYYISRA